MFFNPTAHCPYQSSIPDILSMDDPVYEIMNPSEIPGTSSSPESSITKHQSLIDENVAGPVVPLIRNPKISLLYEIEGTSRPRITKLSDTKIIRKIKEGLPENDWNELTAGCFGNILKLVEQVQFSAQLVFHLLSKQIKTSRKHELWFLIAGRPLRFSLQEFAIVTGLNCGTWTNPKGDKEELKILGGERCQIGNLQGIFEKAEGLDKMKIALIWLLEGVLLGRGSTKYIRTEYVEMLHDMRQFKELAWGRVIFDDSLNSLKEMFQRRKTIQPSTQKNDRKENYSLCGFPLALQVWAYEAIPGIGETLAKPIHTDLNEGPLCLNWSAPKTWRYEEISLQFNKVDVNDKDQLKSILTTEHYDLGHLTYEDDQISLIMDNILKGYDYEVTVVKESVERLDTAAEGDAAASGVSRHTSEEGLSASDEKRTESVETILAELRKALSLGSQVVPAAATAVSDEEWKKRVEHRLDCLEKAVHQWVSLPAYAVPLADSHEYSKFDCKFSAENIYSSAPSEGFSSPDLRSVKEKSDIANSPVKQVGLIRKAWKFLW
ncbi:OLC1v1015122C2 [Oldenlandia corymbosa var. corymbosa]|uniref:OLC1v1015122C2 n=1 Tax=Oldenlandia corymbosa var. corymbosa TaxID=529605 RepID=A0AAV1E2X1_OLDCO|nr:OLC1v1015122C2 [Oldenlandia corymbosa var. corymbosa]